MKVNLLVLIFIFLLILSNTDCWRRRREREEEDGLLDGEIFLDDELLHCLREWFTIGGLIVITAVVGGGVIVSNIASMT